MSKTQEMAALHQLELALTHLNVASKNLTQAADIDDFPTARHDMEEIRDRCKSLEKKVEELKRDLDLKRSR